jgi:hypothetical protein
MNEEELATPEPLKPIDWSELQAAIENYVNGTYCDHHDCDCEHYLYESAIETVYGKDIFKSYLNRKFFS